MKRQFSLGTVFRMSDKALLRHFFEQFGAEVEVIPWDKITRRDVDELLKFFDTLPPSKRDEAELALRHIHALACEKGMEAHQTIRQTFEIAFAYDSVRGTSELSAKLPKQVKEMLEEIFLRHILCVTPEEEKQKPFDLSMLLDPNFELTTRPEDRIRATLVAMTVGVGDELTLRSDSKRSKSVREFALSRIKELAGDMPISTVHAKFRFEFFGDAGRPKTLTFEVGVPDSCTLKNQDPARVEKAQYYLKQWRIAHDTQNVVDAAGSIENDSALLVG